MSLSRHSNSKGNEVSGVDSMSAVQECANNFLESGEACWRQSSGVVYERRQLSRCTVCRCRVGIRCVLGTFGWLVLELGKSLLNIAGHRHVDGARFVLPIQRKTEVSLVVRW
jgi:hypothetical protein